MKSCIIILIFFIFEKNSLAAHSTTATVQYCHDGDTCTVLINDRVMKKIRLIGIDAPELPRGKKTGQPFAYESTNFLNKEIKGKTVQMIVFGQDKYNRLLTEIYLNGQNINIEMLFTGNAEVYRRANNKQINIVQYLEYQDFAKNKHIGIWENKNYISPYCYKKNSKNHLNGKCEAN